MKFITILMALGLGLSSVAQNYNFGKVSKEELEEKFNPLDSSASATYLYKYRRTFFEHKQDEGFYQVTEIHERIKIYNQQGFDYATKSIYLYKDGVDNETVSNLKGTTYNLVKGKVDDIKLKNEGIFKTEKSKYFDETKFTMSNIKAGSIIEYKYKIQSPFISNVDEFVFQHDIPVKKIEAKFEAPEYFNFKVNTKGYLSIVSRAEHATGRIMLLNSGGGNGMEGIMFDKNISVYELSNIPALKEEPFVNNINNYKASVKYELAFTKFPYENMEYFSTSWESVVKTIYDSPSFGDELKKTDYYDDEINALISPISDSLQRVALIYDFVKSKMKWNGYYSKFCDDGVKKAYKERVGNVAEINLMLTSMLRYAGLKANPVLVSTRDNGIPLFPTREGYNYVVSSIETPNGIVLLDATNKYSSPNVLPFRTLNWEGRIIREDGSSSLVNLYPKENSNNTISMIVNLEEDGNIEGHFRSIKTKHSALSYRDNFNEANETNFIETLENKYEGLEISEFAVENALDLSKPVTESYKFAKESHADVIDDKIYFSPLFFLRAKENPFKLETREFPVDFGFPTKARYMININLPKGYRLESIPESVKLELPDNIGYYKYNIVSTENIIQLVINAEINQSIIAPTYYDILKEYFKQLIEKENEQIVLIKT